MGVFADLLTKDVTDRVRQVAVDRLLARLADQGIVLNERQKKGLHLLFESDSPKAMRFWAWPPWRSRAVTVEFGEADLEAIEKAAAFEFERMPESAKELIDSAIPVVIDHVRTEYPRELREDKRSEDGFRKRLSERWARPLLSLRLLIELAERLAAESRGDEDEVVDVDPSALEWVLRRLHGRGIRVAKEALLLIEAGYADGAMARWRTLHEISVVAVFIQRNGEECARRYVDHEAVEDLKSAYRYRQAADRLGYAPVTEEEWGALEERSADAIRRYGREFAGDYGWATPYLPGKSSTLASIEDTVSLDHLRPFYRLAGHSVHANPKGILFSLGHDPLGTILLGPSNNGLADPGQNTGLSLAWLTTVLMTMRPNIDVIIGSCALSRMATEAASEWVEAQRLLESESGDAARLSNSGDAS